MMNKSYIATIGVFALSILFSCQATKSPSLTESIVWDTILRVDTLTLTDPSLQTEENIYPYPPSLEVMIKYIYPQNNDTIRRLLAQHFLGKEFAELPPEEGVLKLIAEIKEDNFPYTDIYDGQMSLELYDHLQLENIQFIGNHILSFTSKRNTYKGGMHGSEWLRLYSIDLYTKQVIKEDDIFVRDSREKLSQSIQTKLMQQYKVQELDDLSKEGFFSPQEIVPNENFQITPMGLRYCYNPYEIAPYAMGVIQVDLTWDEISHIIRPGSIIEKYI